MTKCLLDGTCFPILSNGGEIFQLARNSPVFYKAMPYLALFLTPFFSHI